MNIDLTEKELRVVKHLVNISNLDLRAMTKVGETLNEVVSEEVHGIGNTEDVEAISWQLFDKLDEILEEEL